MTAPSTMSAPALVEDGADLQPLPWRRMAWVTWRQHRTALIGAFALIGALALCLLIVGLQLHHAYAAATACHPASSAACTALVANFNGIGNFLSNGGLFLVVPPLIGAFVGAPILAREFEAGTFRYAWTQGFGRWRWTLAKLVALGVVVAVASAALSVLASWYYQPYFASGNQSLSLTEFNPLNPGLFDQRGLAFRRMDPGRLRNRRPGRRAHSQGRPCHRDHSGCLRGTRLRDRGVATHALPDSAGHQGTQRAGFRADREPMGKQGRPGRLHRPADLSYLPAVLPRSGWPGQGRRRRRQGIPSSAWPSTASRSGPATSRPAGSGRSSGSKAAGCSRCRSCSSP